MNEREIDNYTPGELQAAVSKEIHVLRNWVDDVRSCAILRADIQRREREFIGSGIMSRFIGYLVGVEDETYDVQHVWTALNAAPADTARAYLKAVMLDPSKEQTGSVRLKFLDTGRHTYMAGR
jgi:hypothetical protein